MFEDIDDVDIVEPCGFVLYFGDERWRYGLLELIFNDVLDGFVGPKSPSRLIMFRFTSWSCDVGNGCPDGDVIDSWIDGNDVVYAGAKTLFRIGHS